MIQILKIIFPEFELLKQGGPASNQKEEQRGTSTSILLLIDLTFLAILLILPVCDHSPALLGAQVIAFLIYSILFDVKASGK